MRKGVSLLVCVQLLCTFVTCVYCCADQEVCVSACVCVCVCVCAFVAFVFFCCVPSNIVCSCFVQIRKCVCSIVVCFCCVHALL